MTPPDTPTELHDHRRAIESLTSGYHTSRGERFARAAWFREGYRRTEVDAFVDEVALTIGSDLSSRYAHDVTFASQRGGYDLDEVDDWIDRVETYLTGRGR